MSKIALITSGQDGSYMAEFLLAKGYTVHSIIRRASTFNTGRLDPFTKTPIREKPPLAPLRRPQRCQCPRPASRQIRPDETYNLAAQSHVRVSFDSPEYTTDITATGAVRPLEAPPRRGETFVTRKITRAIAHIPPLL